MRKLENNEALTLSFMLGAGILPDMSVAVHEGRGG